MVPRRTASLPRRSLSNERAENIAGHEACQRDLRGSRKSNGKWRSWEMKPQMNTDKHRWEKEGNSVRFFGEAGHPTICVNLCSSVVSAAQDAPCFFRLATSAGSNLTSLLYR